MIERIIIISLFTIGYCCTFWPGMIFEKIGDWLESHLPEWINKPLWQCYICTCFWLGTALYWLVWGTSIIEWLLSVVPAMGLNAVISEWTNKPEEVEIKGVPELKAVEGEGLNMSKDEYMDMVQFNTPPLRAQCPSCEIWQQCDYNNNGYAYCAKCFTIIAIKKIKL